MSQNFLKDRRPSLLVAERIPANTECPFASLCLIKQEGACKHKGKEHEIPFSCASARAFDLLHRT